jgi:uncharacterized protein YlzI (FlbEa/FlbD family)
VIATKKLDGSTMYLNEDLIERVEDGADGQSAVYLTNGGHIIVAADSQRVVEMIRAEKAALLRRVLGSADDSAITARTPSGAPRLSQVRRT